MEFYVLICETLLDSLTLMKQMNLEVLILIFHNPKMGHEGTYCGSALISMLITTTNKGKTKYTITYKRQDI